MLITANIGNHCIWSNSSGIVVYPFTVVKAGADIGENTHIGSHCFIESGAVIGKNVTIKNGCMIWDGVTIEDNCFIGPGVIFTNDAAPMSPRAFPASYQTKGWLKYTIVGSNTSIGAGCIIAPGITISACSRIPMGTVVKTDGHLGTVVKTGGHWGREP